jgi:hypothetical protein
MNKDGPDVSPYGTLVKHDQSETKRDMHAPHIRLRKPTCTVQLRGILAPRTGEGAGTCAHWAPPSMVVSDVTEAVQPHRCSTTAAAKHGGRQCSGSERNCELSLGPDVSSSERYSSDE